ncbi:MAG: molybdopterin-dependent oxidoreductase [Steroidobacteraceae bacterium]
MSSIHTTYCRNCPSVCGLRIEVTNNRIIGIRGDPRHPLSKGYFCVKGLASMDLHNGEDRLLGSRRRMADGSLEDIDVEAALDEIAKKLAACVSRHGPGAVAMYYGTGANNNSLCHSAMKGWFDLIGSPYIFSSMTLDQSAKWVTMGRMGFFATGKYSALDADVIMEVGVNSAVSHMSSTIPMTSPQRALRDAKTRGMKLIVVDPRETETARHADLHLQVKPGEDAALFAGMIHIVLDRGWQDRAFCGRFIRPLDQLRAAVSGFTPDYVADRTGIDRAMIEQATEMFATANRKSVASGTGPNMARDSNLAEHLIEALNALCAGYRRAGDIVRNVQPLFGGHPSKEQVFPPHRSWELGPKCRTVDIGPMFGEYPSALLPAEIVGNGADKIRALIVVGGNPLKAIGDPMRTLAAFKQLELLVTLDPRPTETAAISHYSIATSLPYERFDYSGMYDVLYSVSFAQAARPLLDRPAGVIDDWEFFWGLAQRMGRPLVLKKPTFGASHTQIGGPVLELSPERKPEAEDLVRWMSSQHLIHYDQLIAQPQGVRLDDHAFIKPAEEDDGSRLDLCPADVAAELVKVRQARRTDAAFPFRLTSRRQLESMNSAYSNASKTRLRYPVNPAFMNPQDMEEAGYANCDIVEISSEHGMVVAAVQRDPGLRRGVVSMTHGWGAVDSATDPEGVSGAFVGRLVSIEAHLQSFNFMPLQSAIPVAVRPHSTEPVTHPTRRVI